MGLEVHVKEVNSHVSIKAVGQYSLADLHALFNRTKEESERYSGRGVILDVTGIAGSIPVLDMLVLGEHCSKFWRTAVRVAIVSPVGGLNKFFENVARNRGAQIAVVANEGAGIEWLK